MNDLEIYAPIPGFPNYLLTSRGRVLTIRKGMEELKHEVKESGERVTLSFNDMLNDFMFLNL